MPSPYLTALDFGRIVVRAKYGPVPPAWAHCGPLVAGYGLLVKWGMIPF